MEGKKAPTLVYCYKCDKDRINISGGVYVCGQCGETTYGYVQEWIPKIWLRKKSRHSRRKWFKKFALEYASYQDEPGLTEYFMEVVQILEGEGLLEGRNISRYCYYLKRLASRRGIALLKQPRDIRSKEIMDTYNARLFGVVLELFSLGWDIECKCPYFLSW